MPLRTSTCSTRATAASSPRCLSLPPRRWMRQSTRPRPLSRPGRRRRSRNGSRSSTAIAVCSSGDLAELTALITRGARQESGARPRRRVLKAIELTEFACSLPADRDRRGAGGEPRGGMPDRPPSARRRGLDRAVQLPQHGTALDHPQRDRPGQLSRPEAVRAGAAERRPASPSCWRRRGCRRACSAWCTAAREVVEAICDHPGIAAVTFVGSTRVAKLVYRRGTASLKRVLALGGAKNHCSCCPMPTWR